MTAHELAKALLEGPDLPVIINGWGSDEGLGQEVLKPGEVEKRSFEACDNNAPKDDMGYGVEQPCIPLEHKDRHQW
jgi:hypothetical protein